MTLNRAEPQDHGADCPHGDDGDDHHTMENHETFVLGVDLDGVCADYSGAFKLLVAEALGKNPDEMGEQTHWEFTESDWGIEDLAHYQRLHKWAVEERRMFKDLPVLDHASDVLWNLSEKGVYIRIITHRLCVNWGHEIAVTDTVAWLQQKRLDGRPLIPYRDICFMADKTDVGADLYVDDAAHNIASLRRRRLDAVCFDAPYNRHVPGLRAYGWGDVERIVNERIEERETLRALLR